MATELKMPALSPTMEEGTLAKWLVKEGDEVKSGDILAEIETDKATMEFEAVDEGTIAKILVPEGTDGVKVGQPIALLAAEGEAACAAPAAAARACANLPRQDARLEGVRAPGIAAGRGHADAARVRDRRARSRRRRRAHARRARSARRHAAGQHDRARCAARRDGRGNAPRRPRVRDRRGGRRVSGRLQGHAEPAAGVRRQARRRYADHRIWLCRPWNGRGDGRPAADRRVHDLQLRDAGDRPHHQFGGEDELHVRRADALPDRVPRARTARRRAWPRSTARITAAGTPMCRG